MEQNPSHAYQIILITWRRKNLLRKCLHSLHRCGIDFTSQVILIINGRDLETIEMLEREFPELGYEQISKTSPAEARNKAIKKSQADWLYFLDDDSWVNDDYFKKAESTLNQLKDAAAFGGPDLTPENSSPLQIAIGRTLKSPMATASTRYRHNTSENASLEPALCDEKKLILCNLWLNMKVLRKYNLMFPSELARNEENLLLYQLSKYEEKMFYIEGLNVYHQRSNDYKNVFRKAWLSGFHRVKSFLAEPSSIELVFFVPGLFVLYLLSLPLFFSWIYAFPLFLYLFLVLAFTIKVGTLRRPLELMRIYILHIVINVAYGLGTLSGSIQKEAY